MRSFLIAASCAASIANSHSTAVPGESGNSVIGGDRDTHLAFLRHVKPGDVFQVERADSRQIAYRVLDASVLDERVVWVTKQEGPSRLTLVTCYRFDALRGGERGTRG